MCRGYQGEHIPASPAMILLILSKRRKSCLYLILYAATAERVMSCSSLTLKTNPNVNSAVVSISHNRYQPTLPCREPTKTECQVPMILPAAVRRPDMRLDAPAPEAAVERLFSHE